jgi:hypothetical protein
MFVCVCVCVQVVCGTMGMPTCTVQLKGPDGITRVSVGVGTGGVSGRGGGHGSLRPSRHQRTASSDGTSGQQCWWPCAFCCMSVICIACRQLHQGQLEADGMWHDLLAKCRALVAAKCQLHATFEASESAAAVMSRAMHTYQQTPVAALLPPCLYCLQARLTLPTRPLMASCV